MIMMTDLNSRKQESVMKREGLEGWRRMLEGRQEHDGHSRKYGRHVRQSERGAVDSISKKFRVAMFFLIVFFVHGVVSKARPDAAIRGNTAKRSFVLPLYRGWDGTSEHGDRSEPLEFSRRKLLRNATFPLHGAVKDYGYVVKP